MSHVTWNEYVDVFTFILRQFGFHEKWTNGLIEAFQRNTNCAKHPRNITSHISTSKNVSGENMTRPGELNKMSPKQPKLKVIHGFELSRGPSSERHRMPPMPMGGHWKAVMWLGTNVCMPLHSFRGNLMFHEKWTNRLFRGFSRWHKWCQAPAQCYKSCRPS